MTDKVELYPVQGGNRHARGGQGQVNEAVYLRAYEVYSHVFSPQPALIDREGRGCRGGFGAEACSVPRSSGTMCHPRSAVLSSRLRFLPCDGA
jgi:hypothetical protein